MNETDHKHRGRKFRGKRLKTSLPRPEAEAEAPLPVAKEAERIAKVIARAGLASRREAEAWIAEGRVTVNDARISSPALNVTAKDRIVVDGKPLPQRERTRLFLFHKPRGLVTTSADTHGRPTIFGALPKDMPRLVSIGRLDLNTEGLLLLTNDGGLARALELPATGWLRRYRVRAHGKIDQPRLDALRHGIEVDGIQYGAIEAKLDREQGANVWITFAMREGKNREIRNVLGHLGLAVNRLIRISYGPFQLGELPPSAVEEIKTRALREQLGARIAAIAGADFSGPINELEADKPIPQSSVRRPEGRSAERAAPASARSGKSDAPDKPTAGRRDGRGRPSFEGRLRRPSQDGGEKRERGPKPRHDERTPRPGRGRPSFEGRPPRSHQKDDERPERGAKPRHDERTPRPGRGRPSFEGGPPRSHRKDGERPERGAKPRHDERTPRPGRGGHRPYKGRRDR